MSDKDKAIFEVAVNVKEILQGFMQYLSFGRARFSLCICSAKD